MEKVKTAFAVTLAWIDGNPGNGSYVTANQKCMIQGMGQRMLMGHSG